MKRSLLILFILLIPFMVMAQTAGGAIKRPSKSQNVSKVAPKSQIKSATKMKRPALQHNNSKALTGYTNGHAWVDLGLPSGTLWATMNVGASRPEEYGDYFAWGETKGYNSGKTEFSWSTYKWCNGSDSTLTKYCTNYNYGYNGFKDNKMELDSEDDAAYVNWGSGWRMPTFIQFEELLRYTTTVWTKQNGVYGRKITSVTNGNFIFLPAAGYRCSSLHGVVTCCFYLSSTIDGYFSYSPWSLFFDNSNIFVRGGERCDGRSVRPVARKINYSQYDLL